MRASCRAGRCRTKRSRTGRPASRRTERSNGQHAAHRGDRFAGVKGFCGGFGRRALGAWGEKVIKDFVHESVNEALKLENALVRLRTPQKIALLHYAPIQATVNGEPPEIIAFLGSSRLEEPLD